MNDTKPILQVDNLSVSFRSRRRRFRAVEGVSFVLHRGETLAIVGESGCGKSVTALSLVGLIPKPAGKIESGRVQLEGEELLSLSARRLRQVRGKGIAMIFQEPMTSLNPVFRVGEQIAEAIRLHQKGNKKNAKELAIEAMKRVGIPAPEERYRSYPHEMSGGLRQRVMIAIALACEPSLLIADEPTTALDVTIQAQILELMNRLQKESDMALLLITHDLGVVAEVADRVMVMYAGVVVESTDVKTLFSNPLHPYTQALHRSLPRPEEGDTSSRLETIPGRVPSLDAIPRYCRFFARCPKAAPECKEEHPPLREVGRGHWVRCIKA